MGTCGCIGQAVGAAAVAANKHHTSPRGALSYIGEIQQTLLKNDCYLPNITRNVSPLCKNAVLRADVAAEDADKLRDGFDRDTENEKTGIFVKNDSEITYSFDSARYIEGVKIVFDSDFLRETIGSNDEFEKFHSTRASVQADSPVLCVPKTLAKKFCLTGVNENGEKTVFLETFRNLKRNVIVPVQGSCQKISLIISENYGGTDKTKVFTFEIF